MEKRLVIAVALSIFIIVSFQFFNKPSKTLDTTAPIPSTTSVSKSEELQTIDTPKELNTHIKEDLDILENEKFVLEFSNINAGLKKICLKGYNGTKTSAPLCLADVLDQSSYLGSISSHDKDLSLGGVEYTSDNSNNTITYDLNSINCKIAKGFTLIPGKFAIG